MVVFSMSRLPWQTIAFIFAPVFATISYAQDGTSCPVPVLPKNTIAYSPFVAWFKYYSGSNQHCWDWASCIFQVADEARKQQFAATALVMGLIPLTFNACITLHASHCLAFCSAYECTLLQSRQTCVTPSPSPTFPAPGYNSGSRVTSAAHRMVWRR